MAKGVKSAGRKGRSKPTSKLGDLYADFNKLTPYEQRLVRRSVRELRTRGRSNTLNALWEKDFHAKPVGIKQFLEDPYYLGTQTKELYPLLQDELEFIFRVGTPIQQVILGGSIGWGKTTLAALGMTYLTYYLSCMRDPHKFYELMKGSKIVLGIYSVLKTQAYDSSYSKIRTFVDASPYFIEKFPRVQRIKSKIMFHKGDIQIIAGSREFHAIGLDMFAFLLDEANFLRSRGPDDADSVAMQIYNGAITRLKSRFMQAGGTLPGMVFLISSKRTHRAFLEKHIESMRPGILDGSVHLIEHTSWDVLGKAKFRKPWFTVEIGDQIHPSRLLEDGSAPRAGSEVIEVPGEYHGEFERDVDQALRDIAGVATYGVSPLIHNKELIRNCITDEIVHPFTKEEITLDEKVDVGLDQYFMPERLFVVRRSRYSLKRDPAAPRFVHIDIGLTGDCAGIACVHPSKYKEIRRQRGDGTYFIDRCPRIEVDFMLRIRPPRESEIDISKIRAFVISLRDLGLPILKVTFDGFQSRDGCQIMRKLKFESNVYSVDRNDEPYLYLRQAIVEQRLVYYEYTPFIVELSDLERDIDRRKVDHPKTSQLTGEPGSKDVADCICGAVAQCMLDPRVVVGAGLDTIGADAPTGGGPVVSKVISAAGTVDWDDIEKETKR